MKGDVSEAGGGEEVDPITAGTIEDILNIWEITQIYGGRASWATDESYIEDVFNVRWAHQRIL